MTRTRVLITGAAGRIGTAFAKLSRQHFDLRLADRRTEGGSDLGRTLHALDIQSLESCLVACQGMDCVLHLAADPSPSADFESSLLPTNIVGTYNVFEAAARQGCKRVVFASSAHAVGGYPQDLQLSESMAPRPANMYGVTKAFGEAIASCFAQSRGMSCIAVRIANVANFASGQQHSARDVAAFISERDVVQLLERALLAPMTGFAVVNGVSNNRYKLLALDQTQSLLGYAPLDDAFELLQYPG